MGSGRSDRRVGRRRTERRHYKKCKRRRSKELKNGRWDCQRPHRARPTFRPKRGVRVKKGKMGTGTKKVEDRKGNHEEKTRYRKAMEGKTRRDAPPPVALGRVE